MAEGTAEKTGKNGYEEEATAERPEMVSISIQEQICRGCIQKVPDFLRTVERNKGEYDPVVASFGPYHHGKEGLKFVEDFKPKALEIFTGGIVDQKDHLYKKVLGVITHVRTCYLENSTEKYNDADFSLMILQDACLIIGIITTSQHNVHPLGRLVFGLIFRDMCLLENQIPFWFLMFVLDFKFGEKPKEIMIEFLSETLFGESKWEGEWRDNEEPLHLLEAFRKILVVDCIKDDINNKTNAGKRHYCLSEFMWPWKKRKDDQNDQCSAKTSAYSFRSATDLKAKGINLRPSATRSLKDINFQSHYLLAELQLPTWFVSIYTKVFFLNLVAFEISPNAQTDRTVSTYINLMKSLIDSPKDVKELRDKQIFLSTLGRDEEVVQVYRDINTYEVNNNLLFEELMEKIQKHYNSKQHTWLAELIHTYFKSPWSIIALLAGVMLLCLTFLQTYFTINPFFRQR